jgi:hypothetical protein
MDRFTSLALRDASPELIRDAAAELTARPLRDGESAHDAIAASLERNRIGPQ